MYMVFIIDHIHHLMNESKMLIFAYNRDQRVYVKLFCGSEECGIMIEVPIIGLSH